MIEINTTELKKSVDKLNDLIDEYEENELNIFNKLKDCGIDWQGAESLSFMDNIYFDKKETERFLSTLKNKQDLVNYIYSKYSSIGKKISCDLNKKNIILNRFDSCERLANSIIYNFNLIDRSFYYYELNSINYQKQKIVNVRNEMRSLKSEVSSLYKKIENIEAEIYSKLAKLETIKIEDFDFMLS